MFSRMLSPKSVRSAWNGIQQRYHAKHFAKPSIGPVVHVGMVVSATGYYFHDKHFRALFGVHKAIHRS